MAHPGHSPSPAQGRGSEEGIPQVPHRGRLPWWKETYWGPGTQGSTIATSFSEAEMVNWQKHVCETSHSEPGSSKSQGS